MSRNKLSHKDELHRTRVQADPFSDQWAAAFWVSDHIRRYRAMRQESKILEETGDWIVSDLLGEELARRLADSPGTVHVELHEHNDVLINCPLDLARVDGRTLAERGVFFVYVPAGLPVKLCGEHSEPLDPSVLAVFSVSTPEPPLDVRSERQALRRALAAVNAPCRVIEWGATTNRLRKALQEREWHALVIGCVALPQGLQMLHELRPAGAHASA